MLFLPAHVHVHGCVDKFARAARDWGTGELQDVGSVGILKRGSSWRAGN